MSVYEVSACCWKTSTYLLRTARFAFGLPPIGGPPASERGNVADIGVGGAELSESVGTRFDLTLDGGALRGGSCAPRSIAPAVAGRAGGGGGGVIPDGKAGFDLPGEAVCARGGGGGAAGFASPPEEFLFTHRFRSLS